MEILAEKSWFPLYFVSQINQTLTKYSNIYYLTIYFNYFRKTAMPFFTIEQDYLGHEIK